MCVCVCVCVFVCVRVCLSLLHYVQAEAMRNKRKDAKFRNAEVTRCGYSIYVCVFSSVFVFLFLCSLHVLSACLQTHAKRRRRMFPLICLCVSLSVYVCAFVGYGNEKQTERRNISRCGHHTREKERDRESEAVCKDGGFFHH